MRHANRVTGAATAALLLIATASCGGDDPVPAPSSAPATSQTPIADTAPPSPSEAAAEAATTLLRQYYAVRNELRQDSTQRPSLLKTVAVSAELTAQQHLIEQQRSRGLRQVGDTKIANLEVRSVNLDNSDPDAGKVPTVQVEVCFDVSQVDVLDHAGNSVISADRPDTGWIRYMVANYAWGTDPTGSWRVATSQDIERAPCTAS